MPPAASWVVRRPRDGPYCVALIRPQWLVSDAAVPGNAQLSATSGLNMTVRRNQAKGISAKL